MIRSAFFLTFTLIIVGCENSPKQLSDFQARDQLAAHINSLIKTNHPHFSHGRPKKTSLNVDAFDFLVGKPRSDFPILFANDNHQLTIDDATQRYPDYRIAEWMKSTQADYEDRLGFELFWTQIGLTFGYDAQTDFLVLAESNDVIVDWALFAITDY